MRFQGAPRRQYTGPHPDLLGPIVVVAAGTLLGKALLVAREILLARSFGADDALDVFFMAYAVPQLIVAVIASSLPTALLPSFVERRESGQEAAAERLLRQTSGFGFIGLLFVAALLVLFMDAIVGLLAGGFEPAKQASTSELARVMMLGLPLAGLARIWSGAANAAGRFFVPAVATSAANISVVLWLVVIPQPSLLSVGVAVVGGTALEALAAGYALRGTGLRPRLAVPRYVELRRILRQLAPISVAAGLTSAAVLIDLSMASPIGAGAVAALNLGNRLPLFLTGIVSLTLSAALLPRMAQLAARRRHDELKAVARRIGLLVGGLGLVVVAAALPLSRTLAEAAYLGGSFEEGRLPLLADIQSLYLLQLPFFAISVVGVRVLTALERGRTIAYISAGNLVANVLGNAILIRTMGVRGIALSTSIVYLLSATSVLVAVRRSLKGGLPTDGGSARPLRT